MKPKRIIKPNSHKILSSESEKIKEKLEFLKTQIQIKKKQKEMNKTAQNNGNLKFLNNNQGSITQSNFKSDEDNLLADALTEMKMENIGSKLQEKGVLKLSELMSLDQETIDKWKDIPVGYRIKIKKYIEKHQSQVKESSPSSKQQKPEGAEVLFQKRQPQEIKHIEDIVKSRKIEQVFVPLSRHMEQFDEAEQGELGEQQQEFMIQSLINAFQIKKSHSNFRKKQSTKHIHKKVHWSPQVERLQKQMKSDKQYPKEIISREIFNQNEVQTKGKDVEMYPTKIVNGWTNNQPSPNRQYCWSCLKLIQANSSDYQIPARSFCQIQCQKDFEERAFSSEHLKEVFISTEHQFQELIKKRSNKEIQLKETGEEMDFELDLEVD